MTTPAARKGGPGGVKKLVLKNFSLPPTQAKTFDESKWATLEAAVKAMQQKRPASTDFQVLNSHASDMCAHNMAPELYKRLQALLDTHVASVHAHLQALPPSDALSWLQQIDEAWTDFCQQINILRNVFLTLDRSYALKTQHVDTLWDLGVRLFRKHVLDASTIRSKTTSSLLAIIKQEREGDTVDRGLLQRLLRMLSTVKLYTVVFEAQFLEESHDFYRAESSSAMEDHEVPRYLAYARKRLQEESQRSQYYLDESTRRPLITCAEQELLRVHVEQILSKGFEGLVDERRKEDLQLLYQLFQRVDALLPLRDAFSAAIKKRGRGIVKSGDPEKDKTMVEDLLAFKQDMDGILTESFGRDEIFGKALRDAFETFINERHNKPAELIAKFIDTKLRSGYKECTEEELDNLFDRVLLLFRFINGKDVFEAFYKTHLARRLLNQRSASVDAERSVLAKLKQECGAAFTGKLEGMFTDIGTSQELTTSFRQNARSSARIDSAIEMTVFVLTSSNWPTYQPVAVTLPKEMTTMQDVFKDFYLSKHPNRRLVWQNDLGHCMVASSFPLGKKDLQVSLLQASVLLLFNTAEELSLEEIEAATGIELGELKRTLQSLACAKVRPLAKEPKGRDVNAGDKFLVNTKFSNKHKRIKVNQIQMKETVQENENVTEKVFLDRVYAVDAAIVRIMKTRKVLKHSLLIAALLEQLKFPVKPSDLKKRIESLIDRDYMERDAADANIYRYLA